MLPITLLTLPVDGGGAWSEIGVRKGELSTSPAWLGEALKAEKRSRSCLAETLQVHNLAEVCVGLVRDVDQIGLHKGFGWGWADLERFEERVDACHGLVHSFYKAVIVSGDHFS